MGGMLPDVRAHGREVRLYVGYGSVISSGARMGAPRLTRRCAQVCAGLRQGLQGISPQMTGGRGRKYGGPPFPKWVTRGEAGERRRRGRGGASPAPLVDGPVKRLTGALLCVVERRECSARTITPAWFIRPPYTPPTLPSDSME